MKSLCLILLAVSLCKCNAAVQFDGIDDYAQGPDIAALDGQGKISIVTWLYIDSTCQSFGGFFADYNGTTFDGWGVIRNGSLNDIFIFFRNASGTPSATTTGANFPSNQWAHLAVLYDGSQATEATKVRCQINGAAITLTYSGVAPATTGANTNGILLGAYNNNAIPASAGACQIEDLIVCNRVLTQTELDFHRLSRQTFRVNSPVVEYPLINVPSGTTCDAQILLDISGNLNNLVGSRGTNSSGCLSLASTRISWP